MFINEFYVAVIVGVVIALIVEETIGLSLGGIIVPGYLALSITSPMNLVITYMVAFATYLIVEYVLPKFVIIYGKRQFTATLIIALLLTALVKVVYSMTPLAVIGLTGAGVIVPGLLANAFKKQGVVLTVGTSAIGAGVVYLVITLLNVFFA